MVRYTEERVLDMITHDYAGHKIYILAPLVRSRKGHYRELFESMRRKGYLHIRVDGQMLDIVQGMKVDRYKNHDIEVVIDKAQSTRNARCGALAEDSHPRHETGRRTDYDS